MAFERVTEADMQGKGNLGRPDTPGVDTAEMQRILDELPREVLAPAHNQLADQLEAATAAADLGAQPPESLPEDTPATVQGVLEAVLARADAHAARADNPHAVTAAQTGAYTKEEADAAIAQRVVEIGAGDMAQAVYDPTGQKKDIFAACATAAQGAKADTAVQSVNGKTGAAVTLNAADVGAVQTVDGQSGPAVETFMPGQFLYAPYRVSYGAQGVNGSRHPWVNADDDLDKTVYAALYARVGDSLSDGAADGFFNCRRLTGRFTVAAGGDFSAGSTGGAASHTLTQEELPKLDPLKIYHAGGTGSSYFSRPLGVNGGGGSTTISRVTTSTVNTGYADLSVNLGGKSTPFSTLPPYVAQYVHVHA